jgi:hypothetical protein
VIRIFIYFFFPFLLFLKLAFHLTNFSYILLYNAVNYDHKVTACVYLLPLPSAMNFAFHMLTESVLADQSDVFCDVVCTAETKLYSITMWQLYAIAGELFAVTVFTLIEYLLSVR